MQAGVDFAIEVKEFMQPVFVFACWHLLAVIWHCITSTVSARSHFTLVNCVSHAVFAVIGNIRIKSCASLNYPAKHGHGKQRGEEGGRNVHQRLSLCLMSLFNCPHKWYNNNLPTSLDLYINYGANIATTHNLRVCVCVFIFKLGV